MASLAQSSKNMSTEQQPTIFTENVLLNLLKLLANTIEGCPQNTAFLVETFNVYQTMSDILSQNEYLDLAGQCCLHRASDWPRRRAGRAHLPSTRGLASSYFCTD